MDKPDGALYPIYLEPHASDFCTYLAHSNLFIYIYIFFSYFLFLICPKANHDGRRITLGAMGDSFYEYLIKTWYVLCYLLYWSIDSDKRHGWTHAHTTCAINTTGCLWRRSRACSIGCTWTRPKPFESTSSKSRSPTASPTSPSGADRLTTPRWTTWPALPVRPRALALGVACSPAPPLVTHRLAFLATGGMYALGARHLRPEHGALPTYYVNMFPYIVA